MGAGFDFSERRVEPSSEGSFIRETENDISGEDDVVPESNRSWIRASRQLAKTDPYFFSTDGFGDLNHVIQPNNTRGVIQTVIGSVDYDEDCSGESGDDTTARILWNSNFSPLHIPPADILRGRLIYHDAESTDSIFDLSTRLSNFVRKMTSNPHPNVLSPTFYYLEEDEYIHLSPRREVGLMVLLNRCQTFGEGTSELSWLACRPHQWKGTYSRQEGSMIWQDWLFPVFSWKRLSAQKQKIEGRGLLLTNEEKLDLVRQYAEGVQHLHSLGVGVSREQVPVYFLVSPSFGRLNAIEEQFRLKVVPTFFECFEEDDWSRSQDIANIVSFAWMLWSGIELTQNADPSGLDWSESTVSGMDPNVQKFFQNQFSSDTTIGTLVSVLGDQDELVRRRDQLRFLLSVLQTDDYGGLRVLFREDISLAIFRFVLL